MKRSSSGLSRLYIDICLEELRSRKNFSHDIRCPAGVRAEHIQTTTLKEFYRYDNPLRPLAK
jgi:hypothetical protein